MRIRIRPNDPDPKHWLFCRIFSLYYELFRESNVNTIKDTEDRKKKNVIIEEETEEIMKKLNIDLKVRALFNIQWISIFSTEAKHTECRELKVSALLIFCSDNTNDFKLR